MQAIGGQGDLENLIKLCTTMSKSSSEICHGPEQKRWTEILSPIATSRDGRLLISPPSRDPLTRLLCTISNKKRSQTPGPGIRFLPLLSAKNTALDMHFGSLQQSIDQDFENRPFNSIFLFL